MKPRTLAVAIACLVACAAVAAPRQKSAQGAKRAAASVPYTTPAAIRGADTHLPIVEPGPSLETMTFDEMYRYEYR